MVRGLYGFRVWYLRGLAHKVWWGVEGIGCLLSAVGVLGFWVVLGGSVKAPRFARFFFDAGGGGGSAFMSFQGLRGFRVQGLLGSRG